MANENQDSRASEEGLASEYKQRTRWQKIFPLIICATSFTVQIFVLGFYKAFGPIYVSLLKEFGGDAASTGRILFMNVPFVLFIMFDSFVFHSFFELLFFLISSF